MRNSSIAAMVEGMERRFRPCVREMSTDLSLSGRENVSRTLSHQARVDVTLNHKPRLKAPVRLAETGPLVVKRRGLGLV